MKLWPDQKASSWSKFWNGVWNGNPNQSFCGRCYEAMIHKKRWGKYSVLFLNKLFFFDDEHCLKSYLSSEHRTYSNSLINNKNRKKNGSTINKRRI